MGSMTWAWRPRDVPGRLTALGPDVRFVFAGGPITGPVYHKSTMNKQLLEFSASGSPQAVSRAIEQFATGHGSLNAIVVPWESDQVSLSMAVTSAKADGWAIEHTNLGTIKLTDLGNNLTRVAITAESRDNAERQKLASLFDGFAIQVQNKLQVSHD